MWFRDILIPDRLYQSTFSDFVTGRFGQGPGVSSLLVIMFKGTLESLTFLAQVGQLISRLVLPLLPLYGKLL